MLIKYFERHKVEAMIKIKSVDLKKYYIIVYQNLLYGLLDSLKMHPKLIKFKVNKLEK